MTQRNDKQTSKEARTLSRVSSVVPAAFISALIRVATLVTYYLLLMVTTFMILPGLGIYVHSTSGVGAQDTGLDALITLWLVPFIFLAVFLTVGELLFMRWLWNVGSRRITKLRDAHADSTPAEVKGIDSRSGSTKQLGRAKPSSNKTGHKNNTKSKNNSKQYKQRSAA